MEQIGEAKAWSEVEPVQFTSGPWISVHAQIIKSLRIEIEYRCLIAGFRRREIQGIAKSGIDVRREVDFQSSCT